MNFVRAKSWRRKKSRIGHGGFSNSLCFVYEKTKYIRLNEYSKPHSANIRFFVDKKRLSFGFLELLSRGGIVHNGAVGCCTRHAKFKDSHPIQRRQNRTDASGYAKSLYFTERGLMSGSWGIQDGLSRNNHVVDLCNDERTRKYLPTLKTNKGLNVMNATLSTVGASACKSSGRVSIPAQSAQKPLTYRKTPNGLLAYRHGAPVAWIVSGFYKGQLNNQPKTSLFVEVAYYRHEHYGINLETFDCDTVAEAKASLGRIFGGAA